VTLTATPATGGTFAGWSGACSGNKTCTITLNSPASVAATFGGSLKSLNHIVFLVQENRSFDHYFGALREYWAQNGFADQAFDGLPQFNIPAGVAPVNPSCDPAFPYHPTATPPQLNDCKVDAQSPDIASYHLATQCIENPSPSWNESHVDWNRKDPVAANAMLDGFVQTAANNSRRNSAPPSNLVDFDGTRAMGYYDGSDLNYYYFMASSFATSDRWFSPVMSRTQPNRMYLIAGTSQGHVYQPAANTFLSANTIFQELQNAGISWKVYVNSTATGCSDTDSACLINFSSLGMFAFGQQTKANPTLLANVQSVNQYLKDAANGTLPNVALIEPAYGAALDEHPTVQDQFPTRIQAGAAYVSNLINTLMNGPSWKDSAFILSFDEGGGVYDHVPPMTPVPNPDGIAPSDLQTGDVCSTTPAAPTCNFTHTGYRVPLIVVSPYTRQHYVSHTATDYTAILKLIETRFGVPSLTQRDAAASNMAEFFDFQHMPWATPPKPPVQNTSDACTLTPPVP
jgi:phospholipase C